MINEGRLQWKFDFQPTCGSEICLCTMPFYGHFRSLTLKRHDHGILEIFISTAQSGNKKNFSTADHNMHCELSTIWQDIDQDPETRVALICREGKGFSAGIWGWSKIWRTTSNCAQGSGIKHATWFTTCGKPIVSAVHGPAVGAGLVAGLFADIFITSKTARIIDGHTRLGVAAGRPRRHLLAAAVRHGKGQRLMLLCEALSAEEAERIGLVSLTVDEADLLPKAFEVEERLAKGSPIAIRWTKYALNNWLRLAGPTFDASLPLEFMCFSGPDVHEGIASLRGRREPHFGQNSPI
jgi:enoyl-CoA hydratase